MEEYKSPFESDAPAEIPEDWQSLAELENPFDNQNPAQFSEQTTSRLAESPFGSDFESPFDAEPSAEAQAELGISPEYLDIAEKYRDLFSDYCLSFYEPLYDASETEEDSARDRANPDNYVPSCALEPVISLEGQHEIIARMTRGEAPLTDDNIAALAKFFEASPFSRQDLMRDPLQRRRHADYFAGRYSPYWESPFVDDSFVEDKSAKAETQVVKLLWDFDAEFWDSLEARALASDEAYIERNYQDGLDKIVAIATQEASKRGGQFLCDLTSPEAVRGEAIKEIMNAASHVVGSGEVSMQELNRDPFLRHRHIDALRDSRPIEEYSEDIVALWSADIDFKKSFEYFQYKSEQKRAFRAEHPDVYEDSDSRTAEIKQLVSETLAQIPDGKFAEIARLYESGANAEAGDHAVLDTLTPLLGLANDPPKLEYAPRERGGPAGDYSSATNTVRVFVDNDTGEFTSPGERPVLSDGARKTALTEATLDRIDTVAHELFHARQARGETVTPAQRELYRLNWDNYVSSDEDYFAYRAQLIEAEAFMFGSSFAKKSPQYQPIRANGSRRKGG